MCKPLYITWASIFLCRSDQVCIREETFSRIPMYHSVLLRVCVSGPIWPHLFQPLGFEPQLASARRVENLRGENHRSRSPLLSVYLIWSLEVCNQDSIFFFFWFLGTLGAKTVQRFLDTSSVKRQHGQEEPKRYVWDLFDLHPGSAI